MQIVIRSMLLLGSFLTIVDSARAQVLTWSVTVNHHVNTNRATDFEAIGQALSSGDLASAQAAFAKLQQTFGQSSSSSV